MKKIVSIVIMLVLAAGLLCPGALAQGNGEGAGGNRDENQNPSGTQTMNQGEKQMPQYGIGDPIFINTGAIEEAVNQVQNRETKTELLRLLQQYQICTAGESLAQEQAALKELRNALQAAGVQVPGGEPTNFSYNFGRECGRFLDAAKVAAAISLVTDAEIAANLNALLEEYRDAVDLQDAPVIQQALEALMSAMIQAQLEVDEYTGLQLYKATQGIYLDTVGVEAAITALEDPNAVSALLALLDTYMIAANGGGLLAAQEALTALLDALEAAGIPI